MSDAMKTLLVLMDAQQIIMSKGMITEQQFITSVQDYLTRYYPLVTQDPIVITCELCSQVECCCVDAEDYA